MSDLPTRESIELATGFEIRDWTALDTERVYAIVDAYLDVTLMTEAEWRDSLNVRTVWYCSANGVVEDGACPSHRVCPKGSQYAQLLFVSAE